MRKRRLENRQNPLDLLLAELAKDLLQVGLGLFEFADGLLLLVDRSWRGRPRDSSSASSSAAERLRDVCRADSARSPAGWPRPGVFALAAFPLCRFAFPLLPLPPLALPFASSALVLFSLPLFPFSASPFSSSAFLVLLGWSFARSPVFSASFPCSRQAVRLVAAGGSALNVLLLIDEHAELLEVFAEPSFLRSRCVFARFSLIKQFRESRPNPDRDPSGSPEPAKADPCREAPQAARIERRSVAPCFAQRLFQQGGPVRIARRVKFGHPQQHVFEMLVLLRSGCVLDGELVGRSWAPAWLALLAAARGFAASFAFAGACARFSRRRGEAQRTASAASANAKHASIANSSSCGYSFSKSRSFSLCRCSVCL